MPRNTHAPANLPKATHVYVKPGTYKKKPMHVRLVDTNVVVPAFGVKAEMTPGLLRQLGTKDLVKTDKSSVEKGQKAHAKKLDEAKEALAENKKAKPAADKPDPK